MLPHKTPPSVKPGLAGTWRFRETLRFALSRFWATSRSLCVAIVVSSLLTALFAPISLVIVSIVASELQTFVQEGVADRSTLIFWIIVSGAMASLAAVFGAIRRYARQRLADEVAFHVQREVLRHTSKLDLEQLEDKEIQDVLERAGQDPGKNLLRMLENGLKVASSTLQTLGFVGVLLWIAPVWACVMVLLALPILFARWRLSGMQHEKQRNQSRARRWARYYTKGMKGHKLAPTVKVLDLVDYLMGQHRQRLQSILRENQRIYRWELIAVMLTSVMSIAGIMGALAYVAAQAANGQLGVGPFVAFWMAAWRLRGSVSNAVTAFATVRETHLNNANLQELLALRPNLNEQFGNRPAPTSGVVEVRNLSFTYARSDRPTLRNISFRIEKGETVAIVGHNGAGKTTLAKILGRLYSPSEGAVYLDGVPLDQIERTSLRQQLAYVQQQTVTFEATAAENIALGDWPRLQDDMDAVHRIATVAKVDSMISQMPDGYDTFLGRMFGDHDLSGGQWQQLAIARALACDPSIVILDEPTSGLDVHAEAEMFSGVCELIQNRTTILISHRFSTVRVADRILVLHEGCLVEDGSHDELMAADGVYRAMYEKHRDRALNIDPRIHPTETNSDKEICFDRSLDQLRRAG